MTRRPLGRTLRQFGREDYRVIPYAFNWNGATGVNMHTPSDLQERTTQLGVMGKCRPIQVGTLPSQLPLVRARSLDEYNAIRKALKAKIARQRIFEESLIPRDESAAFCIPGTCVVCGTEHVFRTSFMYAGDRLPDGRHIPNWREHLDCTGCGYVNRIRASLHILFQEVQPGRSDRIYITEQVTPLHDWLAARFSNLTGSEYLGPDKAPGEVVRGIRNEDIQSLSFADNSFDLILSFDVLEHVPFEQQAFAELARCLRPGGVFLFTVPFRDDLQEHAVRAALRDDGTLVHFATPEYHGNPVDLEQGSLCFRYFGWDLLNDLQNAGFEQPEALFYWSKHFSYLGQTSVIFIARKADDPKHPR